MIEGLESAWPIARIVLYEAKEDYWRVLTDKKQVKRPA